ncbi:hypothetical protein SP15_263 [Bacillus phage SP-15]|uniref:Uncharacterized protein n=1 Tax=Bacillus phage SP-15 TaxID=1792032 RepID=A0A127AWS9_9CAUD|nr:hypothetical protein SP15_263 [Bacillus phage SP-15]AMM45070.1 hypothetical protein SP15_263 [Bacillus phage SP-15]
MANETENKEYYRFMLLRNKGIAARGDLYYAEELGRALNNGFELADFIELSNEDARLVSNWFMDRDHDSDPDNPSEEFTANIESMIKKYGK